MWQNLTFWVFEQQRDLHQQLVAAMQAVGSDSNGWLWVVGLSFLYGLFHAAGPGHGKVIITTYLATERELLSRGIIMAALGALCQGLTAITIVYGLIVIAGWLPQDTNSAVDWSERASFLLLIIMGLWLVWGAVTAFHSVWAARISRQSNSLDQTHDHQHHSHGHSHDHSACCGHSHIPDQQQLAAAGNLKTMALIVLAMGLRPCTGAVLVLVFAQVLDQSITGILAVLAMSLGTGIAVALLAVITVFARSRVAQFSTGLVTPAGIRIGRGIVLLGGGTILLLLGASLMMLSFQTVQHPLGLR